MRAQLSGVRLCSGTLYLIGADVGLSLFALSPLRFIEATESELASLHERILPIVRSPALSPGAL